MNYSNDDLTQSVCEAGGGGGGYCCSHLHVPGSGNCVMHITTNQIHPSEIPRSASLYVCNLPRPNSPCAYTATYIGAGTSRAGNETYHWGAVR